MSKLVCGVGFNNGSLPAKVNGKHIKEYALWIQMLNRCFSSYGQARRPNYKGCSVSDSFLNYTFFYEWCQEQKGFGSKDVKGRSWHLDKDILFTGNKIYSEDTCIFVPQEVNSFFNENGATRGEYPIGVYFDKAKGKFKAQCNVNGKRQYLGLFNTAQEAFVVYKPFKEDLCKQLALKWQSEIDERLFNAMMNWEINHD